jgi:hypothetical protein
MFRKKSFHTKDLEFTRKIELFLSCRELQYQNASPSDTYIVVKSKKISIDIQK